MRQMDNIHLLYQISRISRILKEHSCVNETTAMSILSHSTANIKKDRFQESEFEIQYQSKG